MLQLRQHQISSLKVSIKDNFKSGVHFHATGTGKTIIAFNIIFEYIKFNPQTKLIFWICEKKSILQQQFDVNNLKRLNLLDQLKSFFVLNLNEKCPKDWIYSINSSYFWGKPTIVVINRSLLTIKRLYEKIQVKIDLIIHDECHSIVNKSSQQFYKWIKNYQNHTKCIGFSATPHIVDNLDVNPFLEILSKFTMFDAYNSNIILPPIIERFEIGNSYTYETIAKLIKIRIKNQPYKKIVIWCGTISFCNDMFQTFKNIFQEFKFCIDTSIKKYYGNLLSIEDFYNLESFGILFCAGKHKEGSDILNLDTCVFLDYVENRCKNNFIQCIGRVLRKDENNLKKFGLVIDVNAKSCLNLTDKLSEVLMLKNEVFPWKIENETVNVCKTSYNIQRLILGTQTKTTRSKYQKSLDINSYFIRKIPENDLYISRLKHELELLGKFNLFEYLLRAVEILNIVENYSKNIPHVTRGSCGSSLVCYLLGISNIDPVKHNISFSRFLNIYRNSLPDIDFDFPHKYRDEIFFKLQENWPGKVARISNKVYFHDKSARREALRRLGVKGFISKYDILKKYSPEFEKQIDEKVDEINEQFNHYSLHCGGIVYYNDGIPDEDLLPEKKYKTIKQISLDKNDVSKNKQFKIDILSSRALSQLIYCLEKTGKKFNENLFEDEFYINDKLTQEMLAQGNNIGITLAESPLIRKIFIMIKPKNLYDMAVCLSIIRPAARSAKKELANYDLNSIQEMGDKLIFDDDAIHFISQYLKCDESYADKIRKLFAKNIPLDKIKEDILSNNYNCENFEKVSEKLTSLTMYSFCKAHAYSYAQLVWYLAYYKANHPEIFWESTLINCHSSYKPWVHKYEAFVNNVNYNTVITKSKSIFSIEKLRKISEHCSESNHLTNLQNYSSTNFDENFTSHFYLQETDNGNYNFKGLIANSRIYKNGYCVFYILIGDSTYIDVCFHKKLLKRTKDKIIGISGQGELTSSFPIILNSISNVISF